MLFIAVTKRGEVVGTVGLDIEKDENNLFSMENFYEFDKPPHFITSREQYVLYGRWIVESPWEYKLYLYRAVIYAATIFAYGKGKKFGYGEVKDYIANLITKMGINITIIENAKLLLDKIPEEQRGYYKRLPTPKPFIVELEQVLFALEKNIREGTQKGIIVFNPEP
ncbi:hypothetical protein KW791_01440 [Candidatus Parcubacteria bacterium]|nr:hypothetical protein [Candidatus Parcubacteria bacterium]